METGDKRPARTILVVEDHPLVRTGLVDMLDDQADLRVCAAVADAPGALRAMEKEHPDLIVVDLVLQRGSGLELVKQALALRPQQRILVTSVHEERHLAQRALAAGALGFVNKQEPPERFLEAVRTALEGRTFLSDSIADDALLELAGSEAPAASAMAALSDREFEVLGLIGRGLTTAEVADRLGLSPKTIDSHREHIKSKLGIRNMSELIRVAASIVRAPGASDQGS